MKSTTKDRRQASLAMGLTGLLADTYVLNNSTQASHWNVEGPQFHSLHSMFEQQYVELATAIDTIAERIRAIGFYTPSTVEELLKMSRVRQTRQLRGTQNMLLHLIEAHRQVIHRAGEVRAIAEEILDEASADLLIERVRVHEKMVWMLRSEASRESVELAAVEEIARAG